MILLHIKILQLKHKKYTKLHKVLQVAQLLVLKIQMVTTVTSSLIQDEEFTNTADRIGAYYYLLPGMIGDDLELLQKGTGYLGTKVTGPGSDQTSGFDSSNFDNVGFDN